MAPRPTVDAQGRPNFSRTTPAVSIARDQRNTNQDRQLDKLTTLPQPAVFAALAVSSQDADPDSMLTLYRRAVGTRRTAFPASDAGRALHWLDTGDEHVVAFRRGATTCVVSTGTTSFPLPSAWGDVLLASRPVVDGILSPDVCAWLSAVPDGEAPHPHTPAAAGTTKES